VGPEAGIRRTIRSRGKGRRRYFANSSYETKTETESAFQAGFAKQLGNIQLLIMTIGSVVFFTLLLVTGNTMAISIREAHWGAGGVEGHRFSDRFVLFFVLAESLVIALMRTARSCLAILAIPVVASKVNGYLPPLPALDTLWGSLAVCGIFALRVGSCGYRRNRLRIVDGPRRV